MASNWPDMKCCSFCTQVVFVKVGGEEDWRRSDQPNWNHVQALGEDKTFRPFFFRSRLSFQGGLSGLDCRHIPSLQLIARGEDLEGVVESDRVPVMECPKKNQCGAWNRGRFLVLYTVRSHWMRGSGCEITNERREGENVKKKPASPTRVRAFTLLACYLDFLR